MAAKHKTLYLYLALACFLGIILIFVFDGYTGLYDTLTVKGNDMQQIIQTDQWRQQDHLGFIPSASINYGGKVTFVYEIDNRWFTSYKADIEVSVWLNQEKAADLLSSSVNVKAFGKKRLDWTLDTASLTTDTLSANIANNFTVVIKRGDIERKVMVYVIVNQLKMIPVPVQPN
jgi:hypothetical protein